MSMERNNTVADKLAYNFDEAATLISVSSDTLRRLREAGEIKTKRIGRRWVVPHWALEEYLAKPPVGTKRAYSFAEAAELLSIGYDMMRELCYAGKIKTKREGRRWLVPHWALGEYLANYTPVTHSPNLTCTDDSHADGHADGFAEGYDQAHREVRNWQPGAHTGDCGCAP